jgi:hypothetical protein
MGYAYKGDRVVDCWRGQMGSRSILGVWRIVPLCLMWSIWQKRNARCFENMKEQLKNILAKSLFNWTGVYNISLLIFLNLWIFALLLAFKGIYLCIHHVY